jgi:thiol-disulfide isomerase/thioredoxin
MQKRLVSYALIAASAASASIIEDVRSAATQNDYALADSQLHAYRSKNGVTPEMVTAMSWLGRDALAQKHYDKAETYAKQTHALVLAELKHRPLDQDAYLPLALGAAIEVQSQAMAALGDRVGAVEYLKQELKTFHATSIRARIQKNINLLTLEGKPAPALEITTWLGPKPTPLAALKGKPVLLFFWAHWCGDCKTEVPALARLKQEYAGRFALIGPTKRYGFAAQGIETTPDAELKYIDEVRQKYYSRLPDMPVPVSEETCSSYGCSTTPTLVFIDKAGIVRLYHPGEMTFEEMKAELSKLLAA